MEEQTAKQLVKLNQTFYEQFASSFSATRQRLQPGVQRILHSYLLPSPSGKKLLDLGCGNGELARALATHSFGGLYVGLDFSTGLLDEARRISPVETETHFFQADLAEAEWRQGALRGELDRLGPFDFVLAFAALHHLPGSSLRGQVIRAVRDLLATGGLFIHSNWQFLNSPRLRKRIQLWEEAQLEAAQVDEGDYLLDWRSGGKGLRYVHHFDEVELSRLAEGNGFTVQETFYSDGEGGNLGLYQVWKKASPGP
jgi:tRNA (uracil-5-)-methyltransferase TRM9